VPGAHLRVHDAGLVDDRPLPCDSGSVPPVTPRAADAPAEPGTAPVPPAVLVRGWALAVGALAAAKLLSLAEPLGLLPGPDHVFPPGDVLLLLGTDAQLAAFTKDT